jgi:hypothetical protein
MLTGADHSQAQYLTTVLALPLTGLLACYFALRYPSALGRLYHAAAAKTVDCDPADPVCAVRKADALKARCRMGAGSVLGFALTQAGSALEPDRAFDVMERDQQLRQMAGSLFHFVPTDRAALICRMHLAQPFRNV